MDVLESPVFVDTPVGGRVDLDRVCRDCEMTIEDHCYIFDFIVLEMFSFLSHSWYGLVVYIPCSYRLPSMPGLFVLSQWIIFLYYW